MGRDRSLADWHAPILPFAMVLLGAAMGASPRRAAHRLHAHLRWPHDERLTRRIVREVR